MNKNKKTKQKESGFTLIEILVVIGLIALLAATVIIAINPARQFAQGRNSQRISNVNAILNAIGQRIADNKGVFIDTTCTTDIPAATSTIGSSGGVDLRSCLVPTYMPELPVDPKTGVALSGSNYDTKYTVVKDATTGRITVAAPEAATETVISTPAPVISVTR